MRLDTLGSIPKTCRRSHTLRGIASAQLDTTSTVLASLSHWAMYALETNIPASPELLEALHYFHQSALRVARCWCASESFGSLVCQPRIDNAQCSRISIHHHLQSTPSNNYSTTVPVQYCSTACGPSTGESTQRRGAGNVSTARARAAKAEFRGVPSLHQTLQSCFSMALCIPIPKGAKGAKLRTLLVM